VLFLALALGACGASVRKEIEGNNTGGNIPPALLAGKNAQAIADAHCAKWGTRARITFSGAEAGGDTVFVCEGPTGPAMMAPPAADTKGAAAATQAPAKR
jgi:hypothetical protein